MQSGSSATLKLFLFGSLRIQTNDATPRALSGNLALLLGYLAMHEHDLPRSQVAGTLFPDVAEEQARRLLTHTLYRLRKDIGDEHLHSDTETIGLRNYWSDVSEFRLLVTSDPSTGPKAAARDSDPTQRLQAIQLYSDDLLNSLDADWLLGQRVLLRERYLQFLTELTTTLQAQNRPNEAILQAHRWTQADPLNEAAHTCAMQLYMQLDRPRAALKQYDMLAALLAEELGVQPLKQTTALAQTIRNEYELVQNADLPDETEPVPFVGRRTDRRRLLAQLDSLRDGKGSIIFVEGEPGIGKTRLLGEVAEAAEWRGITTFSGKSAERSAQSILSPLAEAFSVTSSRTRILQLQSALTPMAWTTLCQALPALSANKHYQSAVISATHQTVTTLQLALQQLLHALTAERPLLLLLDDVQWADITFWQIASTLSAVAAVRPLMVIFAYRSSAMRNSPQGWEALQKLDSERKRMRIGLQGLNAAESAELLTYVAPALSSDSLQTVHQQSGGNPLFLLGISDQQSSTSESMRQLIDQRIAHLSADALRTLQNAAALGSSFDFLSWQALCDERIPIDQLISLRFIAEDETGYRFQHDIIRAYLYDLMSSAQKQAAHRRAANWLKTASADLSMLAWHYAMAGEWQLAVSNYQQAATNNLAIKLEAAAHESAHHAQQLIDQHSLARQSVLRQRMLQLRLRLLASWSSETEAEALSIAEVAAEIGDLETLHQVTIARLKYVVQQGRLDELESLGGQAIDLAQEMRDVSAEITTLLDVGTKISKYQQNTTKAAALFEQALTLAEQVGQPGLIANGLIANIQLNHKIHRWPIAEKLLERLDSLIANHPQLASFEATSIHLQALVSQGTGHFERSMRLHKQYAGLVRQTSGFTQIASALYSCCFITSKLGQLEEMVMYSEELLAYMLDHSSKVDEYRIIFYRARLVDSYLSSGNLTAAEQGFEPVLRWLEAGNEGRSAYYGFLVLGFLRQMQDRHADAVTAFEQVVRMTTAQGSLLYIPMLCLALAHHLNHDDAAARAVFADVDGLIDLEFADHDAIFYYEVYSYIFDKPLALARARALMIDFAYQMRELQIRCDAFSRKVLHMRINTAWALLKQPIRKQIEIDGTFIIWTVDDRLYDEQLLHIEGKAALRQHRIKRLVLEANLQGTQPTHPQLAKTLGVALRTIERDFKALSAQDVSVFVS